MKLNSISDINSVVDHLNQSEVNLTNPDIFYSKQLLDTIRYEKDEYKYFRYAEKQPIKNKANKLVLRRWAPLQAHTVPLTEGIPPKSDKGSLTKYELDTHGYGRYMEFTDRVDFKVVDPVVAHYAQEYSIVAIETLDLLAREALMLNAQKRFAGGVANLEAMTIADCEPTLLDLRLTVLSFKNSLVKPRSNGKYHVITSPEFTFDMISDTTVEKYMNINQDTMGLYKGSSLPPMFDLEFYETMQSIKTGEFITSGGKKAIRAYKIKDGSDDGEAWASTEDAEGYVYRTFTEDDPEYSQVSGYVQDERTGQDASYIPDQDVWTLPAGWSELKIHHTMVLGKDALIRTELAGEGQTKMYTKKVGTTGVLDPVDQRQSIGFRIKSVGFGTARAAAIVDYLCLPTQANI
jgi:hypothetical protein